MRRPAAALAFGGGLLAATVLCAPAAAQLSVYATADCFAFWKLKEKLDRDGVGAVVAAGPQAPDGGLPAGQMERVTLYLDLEEKLRFRCPDFAPPPDRAPGKRQPDPPVVTAKPDDAAPPQAGPPLPMRRPAMP